MGKLERLVADMDKLSLADQLRLAAGLLDNQRPDLAESVARRALDKLALSKLLARRG